MKTRLALLSFAALLALPVAHAQDGLRPRTQPATAAAASTPALTTLEGGQRSAALAAANATLNALQRLQGRFVQTSPGGASAAGRFYIQRPGKMRFEYEPPATLLIVSDGSVVSLRDTELLTTERTPLRSTPLNLILAPQIDLERNARVMRVSRSGPWTLVTLRDRTGEADGTITLHFYGEQSQLRSWDVVDATGARTRITLSDMSQPASLDRRLFRLEDVLENRPGQRR